jgi:hypothetical protein
MSNRENSFQQGEQFSSTENWDMLQGSSVGEEGGKFMALFGVCYLRMFQEHSSKTLDS